MMQADTTTTTTTDTSEQVFPSIELAYPLAVASYEVAQKRLEAIEAKIQTLLAVMVPFSIGFLAFAVSKQISFRSVWFFLALGCFLVSVALSLYGRGFGSLRVISPKHIYEGMLRLPEWEFKKDAIYYAGLDFERNKLLVDKKWKTFNIALIGFVIEVVLAVLWAVRAMI